LSQCLLDTDVFLDALYGEPEAIEFIDAQKRPAVSTITCAEVFRGCRILSQQQALEETLSTFQIIEVDALVAKVAGQLACLHYPHKKKKVLFDCLIAATAQVHGLQLVTRNVKDYQKIFPGLKPPYILSC
jgi:predicted nucleic acid-binding protein